MWKRGLAVLLAWGALLIAPDDASARGNDALRVMGAFAFGSVEDAGYGGTAIFSAGWEFDEVFGVDLQGGVGVTEEAGIGTERFFHLELLFPATMTICSADTWVCPGSIFEFQVVSGIGGARFEGRWSPNVVAGVSIDSFRVLEDIDVGLRVGVLGSFDVLDIERLIVMMHVQLGVVVRFGGREAGGQ